MPPLSTVDPSTLMRPDAGRILAFADRLDAAGDGALARAARRAAEGLDRPPTLAPPRAPLTAVRWR